MENKIVDRFLYEALVTEEVLVKLEREVTACLKPFLGTCMTQNTLPALEATVKNRLDDLIRAEQLPECVGHFTFLVDSLYPTKITTFYHKPYFRKTPKYENGYTCYGIEDEKLYKYIIKKSWQENDLIVCSVEKTDLKEPQNSESVSMLEWDIDNTYPSIVEAQNAIRTRNADAIMGLLDSMEEADWEHNTYVSFAGRIKSIWRRINGKNSLPISSKRIGS